MKRLKNTSSARYLNAHPLRCRRPCSLPLKHARGVSERTHTIPAQLHVVIESAANRMHMRIIQRVNHRFPSGFVSC